MKFEATVKLLHEVKKGVSKSSGNEYMFQQMILEAKDGEEGVARFLVSLGTKQVEDVKSQGIEVGSRVVADLVFCTYITRSSYVENRVYVNEISKIQ